MTMYDEQRMSECAIDLSLIVCQPAFVIALKLAIGEAIANAGGANGALTASVACPTHFASPISVRTVSAEPLALGWVTRNERKLGIIRPGGGSGVRISLPASTGLAIVRTQ